MTEVDPVHPPRISRRWQILLIMSSMAALAALLVARMLGPSDLWDHTQPKTVSYTADIIIHGGKHWILPIERGQLPATKPPLFNWLAVPMVHWFGFNSEIAHRFPSIAAMCLCWLITVRMGRWIAHGVIPLKRDATGALGWLAGLMLASNGAMFKLGYLARPDMLLTLWLLLGWIAATRLLIESHSNPQTGKRWLVAGFWICVILSALTK